jgi:hypothetical protein
MSTKFYLVNRVTGERFKPTKKHYVVLYDSGYPAFVTEDFYQTILPVDMKQWELGIKPNLK